MCVHAKCNILHHTANEHFDSFVLSESSLFVYPTKVMIKTCGTTTLLNAIPKILEYAQEFELTVRLVMYSRKNFLFPQEQKFPYRDGWAAEVEYLNSFFDGSSHILGPMTNEHWCLYLADYSDNDRNVSGSGGHRASEHTLEMMMTGLDHTVAQAFYRGGNPEVADDEKFPGMADILPGSETDEYNFRPCGYSMNGLNKDAYYTIHVTPEPHCSYASFETNVSLANYKGLVHHVLSIFKPSRVTMTFFSEKGNCDPSISSGSSSDDDISGDVTEKHSAIHVASPSVLDTNLPGFVVKHKTTTELEGERTVTMCNLESFEIASLPKKPKSPVLMPFRETVQC